VSCTSKSAYDRCQVGDDADLAAVIGEAVAQDGGRVVLDDDGIDAAVHQQAVGGVPAGAVLLLDATRAEEEAVPAGQADMPAVQVQQPGDQAGDLVAAARAGHADDGDAPGFVLGEEVVDDGLADRLRCAAGGLQVHQQARAGVDLDDGAAGLGQRLADVLGDEVDTGDVQPDGARRQRHRMRHLGMDLGRAVDGDVAVALDQHRLAGGRHRLGREALALQVQQHDRVLAQRDAVEREVLGQAAARVGVDLAVDELDDAVLAVAVHPGRLAARGRDDLPADDQHAVLVAADVALHQHRRALGIGELEGGLAVGFVRDVQRDAAAMVAVAGLDDDRQADVLGDFPGLRRRLHLLAFGHRHADGLQQGLGQVLVAGDALGDGAGHVGLGRPDAALARAVAELHQVAVVQADVRDAAVGRRRDDGRGGGAEVAVVQLVAHAGHGGRDVEGLVVDDRHDEGVAFGERRAGHLLVARAEHHAVDAALAGRARLAEAGWHAGEVEQLDDDVLQHMAHPGAVTQALDEAAAFADAAVVLDQVGQGGGQAVVEAGQHVAGVVLQFAQVEPDLQHRPVGPHVGPAQVVDAQQADVVLLAHGIGGLGAGKRVELCAEVMAENCCCPSERTTTCKTILPSPRLIRKRPPCKGDSWQARTWWPRWRLTWMPKAASPRASSR
jgi:hypothetical protein